MINLSNQQGANPFPFECHLDGSRDRQNERHKPRFDFNTSSAGGWSDNAKMGSQENERASRASGRS
jgi:hypothetical protein